MSSIRITPGLLRTLSGAMLSLVLGAAMGSATAHSRSPTSAASPQSSDSPPAVGENAKQPAALIFQRGQDALNQGKLNEAERDFRQVLALDPRAAAAYANLGVVYIRRKRFTEALEMLRKAEHLLPQVAGIRLNIGLAYYRQNEFLLAIPPLESVVRDQPDALQPRYLLGQCYFFASRWADAADTLEPLWAQESTQLNYLYVLSIAAHRANRKELDERATAQLVRVGEGSPEYHLFMGKAHLNLEQYDLALEDLQAAAAADSNLPFVHFNLGLTYLKKQDYERSRDEFLKDAAVEPDLALDHDELGDVYSLMQQDADAEKSYRDALRIDSRLVNSQVGLAKIYQREGRYTQALAAIDSAGKLDPGRTDIHYLRGQILLHLGRKTEGQKELETAVRIDNERRTEHQKQLETIPAPELLQQDQP